MLSGELHTLLELMFKCRRVETTTTTTIIIIIAIMIIITCVCEVEPMGDP